MPRLDAYKPRRVVFMKKNRVGSKARNTDRAGRAKTSRQATGYGWTWEFRNWRNGQQEICHWAESSKEKLIKDRKPTPDATPIYVALVPMTFWRGLSPCKKNTNVRKRKK